MKATVEQQRCLEAFNEGGSLKIEATAGSGKTTTLRYIVHRGTFYGRALYTTFGRKNIEEAKGRFPARRIDVRTNHSLAFGPCGSRWRAEGRLGARPSPGKLAMLMGWQDATFAPYAPVRTGAYYVLATLDRFMQSSAPAIGAEHALPTVAARTMSRASALQLAGRVAELARSVWERIMARGDTMPCTHDAYLKAWALTRPQLGYAHVLLDEAQDTSELMIGLLEAQENCALVLVGDRYQSIYGFRGAHNAMERFVTDEHATLSQSFRFGHDIAVVANAVLSSFLQSSTRVRGLPSLQSRVGPVDKPFCVLSRTNAALFGELVQRAVTEPTAKLAVVGGVEDLENLVRGAESLMRGERTWVPDLAEFSHWAEVVSAVDDDGYQHLASLVELITAHGPASLLAILGRCRGNEADEASCDQVFSTTHKAKGREFPTVRLCDDFHAPPPDPKERQAHWDPEEGNLLYVAVTRAQHELDISGCFAAQLALGAYGTENAHASGDAGFPSPSARSHAAC
ncbi:UvrD-helicase domain-containing protein [Rhodanobacter denitrificans]|uniref:DNA 3'-5' helicase n=1 Tax=Rhodanobacter denitrificans TaxID=666685 RepID=M4NE51_9GAMM|nr:UvrD-helicase domain-containing protein [Rhodanobacter denitrificans]AGG89055.1 DNA/RNA helicase, superfamily I [Rhodanobacter denitrificans]UJJ53082.1 UvrD-helicase domain-containing protein [Rhodanobacter denitrificans]